MALTAFVRIVLAPGSVILTIHAQTPIPPANDNWDDRISLAGTNFDFTGSTYGATFELGDPTRSTEVWIGEPPNSRQADPNTGSIWWSWTSPISGYAALSLPPIPNFRELYRPQLIVFTDSPVDLNTEVAATLDVIPGFYTAFPINAGETYAFALIANTLTNISYTIHLDASQSPIILQHPRSQTVAAGSACFFTIAAPRWGTNKNVRWIHNGETILGANGPSLLVQNASASSAGEYRAYLNILTPNAITVSEPAILTVEGPDIQPQITIQHAPNSTNDLALQVFAEANQFYFLSYATNFTFDSKIFAPGAFYPFTHEPIPYLPESMLIPFTSTADLPIAFFRAERAGDQKQTCIANLHRLEFAKETWKIETHIYAGWAADGTKIDTFLDGARLACPLGGVITYNALGTPATCSIPGHQQ